MNETVRAEIEGLRKLKVKALQARYLEVFGEESRSSNQAHLYRRVAWRLQALAEGDLSERARERAAQLVLDANLRLRAPDSFWEEINTEKPDPTNAGRERDPRLPPAGTELTRNYKGQRLRVQVLEHGFEFNHREYRSLSAIAYQATGTRWNGFLFFGLKRQAAHG